MLDELSCRPRRLALVFALGLALPACEKATQTAGESGSGQVEMVATPSSQGWTLHFSLPAGSTDARYRLESDERAHPLVGNQITVPMRREPMTIEVTWLDAEGRARSSTHGLDPRAALADSTKRTLEQSPPSWVMLRDTNGTKLLYTSTLIANRCGLEKAVHGVDTLVPDRAIELGECDVSDPSSIPYEATTFIELPTNTEFVSIQLTYVDGSTSRVQRFDSFDRN